MGDEVRFERAAVPGQNFVPRGSEARAGQTLLTPGMRLGYAELALAAQVGAAELKCASEAARGDSFDGRRDCAGG